MENIFDTPAIDLYDYGQNDSYGCTAYYWQEDDQSVLTEYCDPTPAYFA